MVRSFEEAVQFVRENGVPKFISFDHDLGEGKSGYDFAKWLVQGDLHGSLEIPKDFSYEVHSQNPVGAKNIDSLLSNYLRFKEAH